MTNDAAKHPDLRRYSTAPGLPHIPPLEFRHNISEWIEMMAAAYLQATGIPPEECQLTVQMIPEEHKMIYRFEKRGRETSLQGVGMEGLTEGRIVHVVLDQGHSLGAHRPGIVVNVFRDAEGKPEGNGICNIQVFTDSDKDGRFNDALPPVLWMTSVLYSEKKEPGTWHWIEPA